MIQTGVPCKIWWRPFLSVKENITDFFEKNRKFRSQFCTRDSNFIRKKHKALYSVSYTWDSNFFRKTQKVSELVPSPGLYFFSKKTQSFVRRFRTRKTKFFRRNTNVSGVGAVPGANFFGKKYTLFWARKLSLGWEEQQNLKFSIKCWFQSKTKIKYQVIFEKIRVPGTKPISV